MSKKQRNTQVHELVAKFEDLLITGGAAYRAKCSCGYETRPCTTTGTATGLFRRHATLAGRGYSKHDEGTAGPR